MHFFSTWTDLTNPERRELVFEFRNKKFGAYEIRKNYSANLIKAFLLTGFFTVLVFALPLILSMIARVDFSPEKKLADRITLEEPPPIDKSAPPPPPVIPPPPIHQTIKFTPPTIVKDEQAEDPPPTQEETKDVKVSTETQEGIKDLEDLPTDPVAEPEEDKIFTVVEEMPSFPGGEQKLMEYLSRIKYPTLAKEEGIAGWVYLSFIIDKEGKIKEAKVTKGIGGGCDEEALRVLNSLPDWKPGRQNGMNVQVRNNIRINFSLK